MTLDDVFYGARDDLRNAQTKLHKLLEMLQDRHDAVDASEVADAIKATAKAVQEMDDLARKWQDQATKAQGKAESFDPSQFDDQSLFKDAPMSMQQLKEGTQFAFDHLLSGLGDADEELN